MNGIRTEDRPHLAAAWDNLDNLRGASPEARRDAIALAQVNVLLDIAESLHTLANR